jgi:succinoglycan biosynthesis transport protein ExoP
MEIGELLQPLRRWWWLLLACTIVAGVSSFFVVSQQPPIYVSRTTLMIGRMLEDPNPNSSQFYLAQQLASTYADIANREPLREATMQALGIDWLPDYQARALPNSQLIEIAVTDTNPQRAYVIASELAKQLIERGPTSDGETDQGRQDFIATQLDILQGQINNTQDQIEELSSQLINLNSARQIADTEAQIATLTSGLNDLRSNYASLLANTQQGAFNILSTIDPANLPSTPVGPNKMMTVLLSAAVGLALATGAAYLLEYLDDTIKSEDDVQKLLGVPVIGYIAQMSKQGTMPYIADQPRSPIAEAFRTLRTNLEFSGIDKPIKTLVVTSADASDGKTTIAANLAIAFVQAGKKVILLDADLRSPDIHHVMGISETPGLGDVFLGRLNIYDAVSYWKENNKLVIIPAGATPPNPAELLGSKKMNQILESLKEVADVIIIDSPPAIVSDPVILSLKADGVLLVINSGRTRKGHAKYFIEQFRRVNANIIGVSLNRIPIKSTYYFNYNYAPYYYEGRSNSKDGKNGVRSKQKTSIFRRKSVEETEVEES